MSTNMINFLLFIKKKIFSFFLQLIPSFRIVVMPPTLRRLFMDFWILQQQLAIQLWYFHHKALHQLVCIANTLR